MVLTTEMLRRQYCNYSNPLDKIKRDTASGLLFRITRGIYETDKTVNPYLLAPCILSPSYISFEYALSYYGLIPERVYAITSASLGIRKNKEFNNYFGKYTFSDIPLKVFSEGLTYIGKGDYMVRFATKEKALCDSLSKWRVVGSVKELKTLLFEDKRIDENEFETCDFSLLIYLAKLYKKTNLEFLIKLIRKEYLHE